MAYYVKKIHKIVQRLELPSYLCNWPKSPRDESELRKNAADDWKDVNCLHCLKLRMKNEQD